MCKFPSLPGGVLPDTHHRTSSAAGNRVTGTLFGYRKGRVNLSVQENPRTLPTLVVELAMQTNVLQREMSVGMVRIALECEKRPERDRTELLEEPLWNMYCNGKKSGYGVKREATEEDLQIMELLRAVSMGAGVLPGKSDVEGPDGELAYMRAHFERVVGSKDSETLYLLSPDGNNGPELSIFLNLKTPKFAMFDFGDDLFIGSHRIPWLVWIQLIVMLLLVILLYYFIAFALGLDPSPTAAASSSAVLRSEISRHRPPPSATAVSAAVTAASSRSNTAKYVEVYSLRKVGAITLSLPNINPQPCLCLDIYYPMLSVGSPSIE
ncbi:hypothetical protein RHSIM_Rhsim10G0151100 [Rhododendron simsii]|uniref:Protein MIZU-KUSSEI 1 n=1 Tax=Rhododendron simsii TaxID=118357 RepID=A0A834GC70_RHOSS|nr:hypothetical protein RHSIM_Rhsim10G0151100 [Rhododendron simsii]